MLILRAQVRFLDERLGRYSHGIKKALGGSGNYNFKNVAADAFGNALGNAFIEYMKPETKAEQSKTTKDQTTNSVGGGIFGLAANAGNVTIGTVAGSILQNIKGANNQTGVVGGGDKGMKKGAIDLTQSAPTSSSQGWFNEGALRDALNADYTRRLYESAKNDSWEQSSADDLQYLLRPQESEASKAYADYAVWLFNQVPLTPVPDKHADGPQLKPVDRDAVWAYEQSQLQQRKAAAHFAGKPFHYAAADDLQNGLLWSMGGVTLGAGAKGLGMIGQSAGNMYKGTMQFGDDLLKFGPKKTMYMYGEKVAFAPAVLEGFVLEGAVLTVPVAGVYQGSKYAYNAFDNLKALSAKYDDVVRSFGGAASRDKVFKTPELYPNTENFDSGVIFNPTLNLREYGINPLRSRIIENKLNQSDIGQYVLSKAREGVIELHLSIKPNILISRDMGEAEGNIARTFVRNTQTFGNKTFGIKAGYDQTVSNMVHEGVHALGVGGSRKAEAIARLAELQHNGIEINRASMRKVLQSMKGIDVYDSMQWKINKETVHFPSLKF